VSFAAAEIVSYLAAKIPGSGDFINDTVVTGLLWAIIDGLIGLIPATIIKKYAEEIQSTLVKAGRPVKIDGLALSKTSEALSIALEEENENTQKKVKAPTPEQLKKNIKPRSKSPFMNGKTR
jgi:hypothetical protein